MSLRLDHLLQQENIEPHTFIGDLESVLRTPAGRNLFWLIIRRSGFFDSEVPSNAEMLAWRAGARSVGRFILQMIDESETNWLAMMMDESSSRAVVDEEEKKETEVGPFDDHTV